MREKLADLRATLQELKKASMFKKALAAEAALLAAMVLIEEMVGEIEKLKKGQAAQPDKTAAKKSPTPHPTKTPRKRAPRAP